MHSIIIPTFGRFECLKKLLDNLPKNLQNSLDTEILIIDNNSDSDLSEKLSSYIDGRQRSLKVLYYFKAKHPGLSGARHLGVKLAKGDILSFLDDDVIISETWADTVLSNFENDKNVHVTGGPCLPYFETSIPFWFWKLNTEIDNGWFNPWYSLIDFPKDIIDCPPDFIFGLNLSIRKKTLIDLKGFNPDLVPLDRQMFQGDGETGLSYKLKKSFLRSDFLCGALVYHQVGIDRLTIEYVQKRAYYQGVCDSFFDLRELSKLSQLYKKTFVHARHILFKIYNKFSDKKSLNTVHHYSSGYYFHQNQYYNSEIVRNWVHLDNYFDEQC